MTDAVGYGDVTAVGDGMAALDRLPGGVLPLAKVCLLAGVPANGGGEEQNLSPMQRRQARGFGIPLIPADQDADLAVTGLPGAKA